MKNIIITLLIFLVTAQICLAVDIHSSSNEIVNDGWVVDYLMDNDFHIEIDDSKKHKTKICLVHNTITNKKKLADKKLLMETGKEITVLKSKEFNGKAGYCYTTGDEKYLKFGEHSTVVVYLESNSINYYTNSSYINVTLYQNETILKEISVYYDNVSYKFGANDTNNTDIKRYEYRIESPLKVKGTDNILTYSDVDGKYKFDFSDICDKNLSVYNSSPNCIFDYVQHFENDSLVTDYVKLLFISDSDIDPTITIEKDNFYSNSMFINTSTRSNFSYLDAYGDTFVTWRAGKIGNSLLFNGEDNYVNIDTSLTTLS